MGTKLRLPHLRRRLVRCPEIQNLHRLPPRQSPIPRPRPRQHRPGLRRRHHQQTHATQRHDETDLGDPTHPLLQPDRQFCGFTELDATTAQVAAQAAVDAEGPAEAA